MLHQTPLHARHQALGARLVDFGGWDMPLHYGSQLEEHHVVRRAVGMFDVSHMRVVDLAGVGATAFLRHLLANNVARLTPDGKALYSCMLNDAGGVVDDLIVYRLGEERYRLVVNAGTADKDLAWMAPRAAAFGVRPEARADLAMIAVQGPQARERTAALWSASDRTSALGLPTFSGTALEGGNGALFVARTGYTGEDGFEIMMPAADAVGLWDRLLAAGVRPCGLGARDTLRLEAGMNLYGNDMTEATSPLESGLAWTVAFDAGRDFIGRTALEAQRTAGVARKQVGLLLEDKGVLRAHQTVLSAAGEGEITSGTYSPTLERSIALARVPAAVTDQVDVDIRGKRLRARVVRPPFVRHGQPRITL